MIIITPKQVNEIIAFKKMTGSNVEVRINEKNEILLIKKRTDNAVAFVHDITERPYDWEKLAEPVSTVGEDYSIYA